MNEINEQVMDVVNEVMDCETAAGNTADLTVDVRDDGTITNPVVTVTHEHKTLSPTGKDVARGFGYGLAVGGGSAIAYFGVYRFCEWIARKREQKRRQQKYADLMDENGTEADV